MASIVEPVPRSRVVIVGAGFGGLAAAQALRRAPVEITLVDQRNHHLFQPLLYQVATAGLSPADIAAPIRAILRRNANTKVLLDRVIGIDAGARCVRLAGGDELPYDYLLLATGATPLSSGPGSAGGRRPAFRRRTSPRRPAPSSAATPTPRCCSIG